MVDHLLMMRWVVGWNLYGGPIELFLIPTSAPQLVMQKNHGLCYPVYLMVHIKGRKEENVLFNRFYLRLYGVTHMVKDHSDSEKGNLLPPQGLIFVISSKGSFICTIPQTG